MRASHRSGRVGRIGQPRQGKVVSIVDEEGACLLTQLGAKLKFTPVRQDAPEAEVVKEESSDDDKVACALPV